MAYQSLEDVPSRYQFVHVVARRARKLQGGAPSAIAAPTSKKPTRIAEMEAMQGLIAFTAPKIPGAAGGEDTTGE